MKKNRDKSAANRILGRRLAREMPNQELGRVMGGVWTYTLLYPSDPTPPKWDGPEIQPGNPILFA